MPTPRRQRNLAIVLVVVALAGWWGARRLKARRARRVPLVTAVTPAAPAPTLAVETPTPTPEANQPAPRAPTALEAPSTTTPTVTLREILTDLDVEPEEPCAGEDVLVTALRESGLEGAKVAVNGRPGDRVVVRFDQPGPQRIWAVADDWSGGYDRLESDVVVRACPDEPRLSLNVQLLRDDEALVEAVVPGGVPTPDRYDWEFGDGTTISTTVPAARHSFALRPQAGPQQTLLLAVRAHLPTGSELAARRELLLVNEHFATRGGGVTFLPVVAERFPTRNGATLTSSVQVRNLFPAALELDRVDVRGLPCRRGDEPIVLSGSADQLLGQHVLEADAIATLQLSIDAAPFTGRACALEVRATGTAAGEKASLLFGLELDAPDFARPVVDPSMQQRILAAQQILGRDRVTREEVLLLQKTGQLDAAVAAP